MAPLAIRSNSRFGRCARNSSRTPSSRTSPSRSRASAGGFLLLLLAFAAASTAAEIVPAPSRERRVLKRWTLTGEPRGLAVAADGTAYIGLAGPQSVIAVDPVSGTIKNEVVLDSEEIASTKEMVSLRITPKGDRLIVANGRDESVTILKLPELTILREIGLEGETVRDALPDPAGRYLYVLGRSVHVYDADGNRELRALDGLDPMAIATDSKGSLLAVVGAEEFASGRATSVALYETATFKTAGPDPLQTDKRIESAAFAADDKALVILARDWLAEKTLLARREGTLTAGDGGSMRLRFLFGDLISSEAICLPDQSGPQIAAVGNPSSILYVAEKRCTQSGSFIASARKVTAGSLYGVDAYAIAYHAPSHSIYAIDRNGYLTIYKAPRAGR